MTEFSWKAPEYRLVPAGTYEATFVDVEHREGGINPAGYLRWKFDTKLPDGTTQILPENSSANLSYRSKAGIWIDAIQGRPLEPGERLDKDAMGGSECRVVVGVVVKDGREFNTIEAVLPPVGDDQQPDPA